VEILWFMPITPISLQKRLGTLGSYYSCADYVSTNPEFGTVDDFRNLVSRAHAMGFKVLIDWVANHTGWDHVWTRTYPDYYKKNKQGNFFDSNGWEDVIDLNYDNPALRRAMIDSMEFWIRDADIDGFRCDMAMLVPLDFWKEARLRLDAIKKLFWLAECEEPPYLDVFDACYTWKLLHKMEAYWRKETDLEGLTETLKEYNKAYPPTSFQALFTSNHDENSHSGTEYERMGDAAKPFAVLCATWNGIPLVYSGQELPNMKRLRFFERDPIVWTGPCMLADYYRKLLELRKKNSALRAGDPSVSTKIIESTESGKVFAYCRVHAENKVLVILNLSADPVSVRLNDALLSGPFHEIFTRESLVRIPESDLSLKAWDFRVYAY